MQNYLLIDFYISEQCLWFSQSDPPLAPKTNQPPTIANHKTNTKATINVIIFKDRIKTNKIYYWLYATGLVPLLWLYCKVHFCATWNPQCTACLSAEMLPAFIWKFDMTDYFKALCTNPRLVRFITTQLTQRESHNLPVLLVCFGW